MKVNNHIPTGQNAFVKNTGTQTNNAKNAPASSANTQNANVDTVSFSAEALQMLNSQQTTWSNTANEVRIANGLPARETPSLSHLIEREFTVFSLNALAPHMENADRHLGLMKRAISDPNRFTGEDLTLEERTHMRESILQEANRIAETYLSGEEAQRFVDGFQNLIREAEMVEQGYVRVGSANLGGIALGEITLRRPFDEADSHSLNLFVDGNMTDSQRVQFNLLNDEVNRLLDLHQAIATGEENDSEMSFQEVIDALDEARMALNTFIESMGEQHGFQNQWDIWQAGNAPSDNWFVQATADFESNSANIAEQIAEARLNFHTNGMDGLRSVVDQIGLSDAARPSWQWLTQLQVFSPNE
jgi:hypothetical protein